MTSTSGGDTKKSRKRRSDRRRSSSGKRRRAREMALQMLYQQELGGSPAGQIFSVFNLDDYQRMDEIGDEEKEQAPPPKRRPQQSQVQLESSFTYARQLVEGTLDHGDQIDGLIRQQAENWRLERMPAIDRNILRLALYEMLYQQEVPRVVIVDEAIELAKKFGSEHSGRFINGLLDGVLKAEKDRPSSGEPSP